MMEVSHLPGKMVGTSMMSGSSGGTVENEARHKNRK